MCTSAIVCYAVLCAKRKDQYSRILPSVVDMVIVESVLGETDLADAKHSRTPSHFFCDATSPQKFGPLLKIASICKSPVNFERLELMIMKRGGGRGVVKGVFFKKRG